MNVAIIQYFQIQVRWGNAPWHLDALKLLKLCFPTRMAAASDTACRFSDCGETAAGKHQARSCSNRLIKHEGKGVREEGNNLSVGFKANGVWRLVLH